MVTPDSIVVVLSAVAAAASFTAFVLPMMNREEKRERTRAIIEKRRRTLFEQTKAEATAGRGKQALSARESVVTVFKVQKIMGAMGEKLRDQMLQAGIRSPSAPLKFIIARFSLGAAFALLSMLILSKGGEELSSFITFLTIFGAAFLGYKLPGLLLKNQIQKRAQEFAVTFPDALDMLLICVQGGIGLEQAVNRIAEEMAGHSPVLAEELGILSAEMAMLNDRRKALQGFAKRVGTPAARSFAAALVQAEQYGTSVSQALRVMADELRDQRMALAEQKAASLPPKLTVPMILFFLPVLFIVILGPSILQFVLR